MDLAVRFMLHAFIHSFMHTINIDKAGAMSNQAIRGLEQVVESDAEANILDDLGNKVSF